MLLDLLVLWRMCVAIGVRARKKGRAVAGFQLLTVALFIGGELTGWIIGLALTAAGRNRGEDFNLVVRLYALLGAVVGATIPHVIVNALKPIRVEGESRPTESNPE